MSNAEARDRNLECNIAVPSSAGPCDHCGQLTHDLDLSFEAWLCWPTCHDAMWSEYLAAEAELEAKSPE